MARKALICKILVLVAAAIYCPSASYGNIIYEERYNESFGFYYGEFVNGAAKSVG